jgi:hypothetical protein
MSCYLAFPPANDAIGGLCYWLCTRALRGARAPRTSSPCCSLSSPKRRGCERNARTRNGSPPDKGASMSMELQYDKRTRPRTSHYGVGRYWILEGKCIFKATLSLSLSLSGCSTEPLETCRWGTYFVRTSSPLVAMACSNMSKMIDHQRSTKRQHPHAGPR